MQCIKVYEIYDQPRDKLTLIFVFIFVLSHLQNHKMEDHKKERRPQEVGQRVLDQYQNLPSKQW